MSSYNQVFVEKYMKNIKQLNVVLRGKCNAGEVYSDVGGVLMDLSNAWLV